MIQFRVEKDGEMIFHKELADVAAQGAGLAEFAKVSIVEFRRGHPTVSLSEKGMLMKFAQIPG